MSHTVDMRDLLVSELNALRADFITIGARVLSAVNVGTQAFLDADLAATEAVIQEDTQIDALCDDLEERAIQVMATQQPIARDLRFLVVLLRSVHELERAGDLVCNIVKGGRRIYPRELDPRVRGVIAQMGNQAARQMELTIEAFAERDENRAAALVDMDDTMDDLLKELLVLVFQGGAADHNEVQEAVQVALIGRYYERYADHAVNVAERIQFWVTGNFHGHDQDSDPDQSMGPVAASG
jgi:phosphate transport system protein